MLVIGVLALILLLGPWAWRSWEESHLSQGKVKVFDQASAKSSLDLAMCVMKHEPGKLTLAISSENHFTDPARGLVVEVTAKGDRREVTAWLPQGVILHPGEVAQLSACVTG